MGMNNRVVRDIQFTDLPHRLESMNGSKWLKHLINDSKATNLAALEYALNKMDDSYFLILCGDPNKEQYKNYKIIGPEKIFIFGSYAAEIYKRISHPNKILLHNQDLLSVMNKIRSDKSFPYIQTILFSPGHPSGNDYKNFEQRGDHFKQLVREICVD